jgi:hypothetical protein
MDELIAYLMAQFFSYDSAIRVTNVRVQVNLLHLYIPNVQLNHIVSIVVHTLQE